MLIEPKIIAHVAISAQNLLCCTLCSPRVASLFDLISHLSIHVFNFTVPSLLTPGSKVTCSTHFPTTTVHYTHRNNFAASLTFFRIWYDFFSVLVLFSVIIVLTSHDRLNCMPIPSFLSAYKVLYTVSYRMIVAL